MTITLTDDQKKVQGAVRGFYTNKDSFLTVDGSAGCGKEQPISTYVQTPKGRVLFGNLKVGDTIFGANGKPTKVTAIYPQGVKPVYEFTFRDGSKTKAGKEHLWSILTTKKSTKPKVLTTQELLDKGIKYANGQCKYKIPLCSPVEYEDIKHEFDPYLIGALIGDGSLTSSSPVLTCGNKDLNIAQEAFTHLDSNFKVSSSDKTGCVAYTISDTSGKGNRLTNYLRASKLDVTSKYKFIPLEYLNSSIPQRKRLLQGLMDTDGCSFKNRISYSTMSLQLAKDVITLVQSLGGTAILRVQNREHESKGIEYGVNVKVFFNPFGVSIKKHNWKLPTKHPPSRYITSINLIGEEEQMCITVDAEDSLYLTDEFIVTHNTTVLKHIYESEQNLNNTFRTIDPNYTDKHMILTATTNKAVNVLQSQFSNTFVNVRTIHSLFGLRPFKGKLTCSHTPKDLAQSLKDRIIIIDECSMINDELYQIIKDVAAYGIKFIFVGDSNQLPPVKSKSISPVFSNPTVKLTEVVRQTDELLLLADSFRKFVELDEFPNIQPNGTSIIHLPQDEFEQMILDDMGTPGWTIRDSRVVAYTNKQVKHYNSLIKEDLTGTAAIVEGELVINNSYIKGNPNIAVPTEAEVYIRKIMPHKTIVEGFRYSIVHGMKETTVWMPKGPEEAKELQRVIKGMDSTPYYIYNVLADLRPMYASTIHKAQGSTFKRIYIDLNSIKSVQYYDPLMFKRLLYVAVSRASECVVFTGDI